MRLDRASLFPGDDRSIDAHCLDLVAAGAILIGAYVKGVMRAAAEIVPDRTARRAEAAITIEHGFHDRGFERELTARIIDEARRYHLNDVRVQEQCQPPATRSRCCNCTATRRRDLRRQRIGRLDHVGAAADRGARREQHESRHRERQRAERRARRQIFRDLEAR